MPSWTRTRTRLRSAPRRSSSRRNATHPSTNPPNRRGERTPSSTPLAASTLTWARRAVSLSGSALEFDVQHGSELHVDEANDLVLRNSPWIDQRTDGLSVADVDAGVVVIAPHQEITNLSAFGALGDRRVLAEPVVVAGDGLAASADAIE